jgi:hypothetical protein
MRPTRAQKHIGDISARLLASSNTYGPTLNVDIETGEKFLEYGFVDRELSVDIALIVGDAIHNIHSALDIAWGGLLDPATVGEHSKFPIHPKAGRKEFESAITAKGTKISIPPRAFEFFLTKAKPYMGGNSDLLAIHVFDIDDKHRLIIPTLAAVGIEGVELENEDGTIDEPIIVLTGDQPYRKRIPENTTLKNHGEVRFHVTFREGVLPEGTEVVPTLCGFADTAWFVIRNLYTI